MKEKNKLIIAILTVVMIIVAVVGATYAYWTWSSNEAEQTTVNFTVPSGSDLLSATLDGGTMANVSNLAPIDACQTYTNYVAKSTVTLTYTNGTTIPARVLGTITVNNFPAVTTANKPHIHYSLRTGSTKCNDGTVIQEGTFNGITTSGNLFSDVVLASNIGKVNNGTKTMQLYVWIDSGYTHENVGSGINTDPIQNATFTLVWSGSITTQPTS